MQASLLVPGIYWDSNNQQLVPAFFPSDFVPHAIRKYYVRNLEVSGFYRSGWASEAD